MKAPDVVYVIFAVASWALLIALLVWAALVDKKSNDDGDPRLAELEKELDKEEEDEDEE